MSPYRKKNLRPRLCKEMLAESNYLRVPRFAAPAQPLHLPAWCWIGLLLACTLWSCGDQGGSGSDPEDSVPTAQQFADEHPDTADLSRFHVRLWTSIDGRELPVMTLALWPDVAPRTVRNFLRLCRAGFYNGLAFHRLVPDLMIQGGCTRGDGTGGSPFGTVPAEFSHEEHARHRYGTLSMARGRDPDSAGAQFFIVCRDGPLAWSLDGQYSSFGQLVAGEAALEALRDVPVQPNPLGERSDPIPNLRIVRAEVVAGPAPASTVREPALAPEHRWGPPNTAGVESLMVAYGSGPESRTEAEALERAKSLLAEYQNGRDFHELILEASDDPVQRIEPLEGTWSSADRAWALFFAQRGSNPLRGQRAVQQANEAARVELQEVAAQKRAGTLTPEQAAQRRDDVQWRLQSTIRQARAIPFDEWPDLAAKAFELEVGETSIVVSQRAAPFRGVFVLRRVE